MHGLLSATIPAQLQTAIARRLEGFALNPSADAAKIAKAVHTLSTFYLQQPKGETPYHQAWAQIARSSCVYEKVSQQKISPLSQGHGFFLTSPCHELAGKSR